MTQQAGAALPRHVGIIMDGNGRWAKARGLSRNQGHKRGAEVFGDIVRHAKALGIEYLTVYAFSTENWSRPAEEVAGIMSLLRSYLRDARKYGKENVRTLVLGDRTVLDGELRTLIDRVEKESEDNTGVCVNIAINYGGRDELAYAFRKICAKIISGEIALESVNKDCIASELYTSGQPDADLIIRTGGEKRVSNFLLWQGAYAEYVFTDVLWPDFGPKELDAALAEYAGRERRMGGL